MFFANPKNSEEHLVKAIHDGNISKVISMVPTVLPVSAKLIVPGGKQALHVACDFEKKEIVDKLIELGADVNATTDRGFISLHRAAQKGSIEILLSLIKAGSNIDTVSDNGLGTTPLQEAAYHGQLSACNVLLTVGANADYKEKKFNLTAADLAREQNHDNIAIGLMGYRLAFIERVKNEINQYKKGFKIDSPAYKYWQQLDELPLDKNKPDDYFRSLQVALNNGHEAAKPEIQKMRSNIIQYMKQYNADKVLEHKVKSTLSSAVNSKEQQ